MKKLIATVIITFASLAMGQTPEEKSLEFIADKCFSFAFEIEQLKLKLDEIKTNFASEDELSENWDKFVEIFIEYRENELEIIKAFNQHHLTFGRGELKGDAKVLMFKALSYFKRVEAFWVLVKAKQSKLLLETENYPHGIIKLSRSLADQVIREDAKED